MTPVAWVALAAAAVFAAGDWFAVVRHRKPLEYLCKPAVMVALVAVALALDAAHPERRLWFVAALVLSLSGDVFLMLPRDLFVFGLGSFLVGHVAYIVGLRLHGGGPLALVLAAVPVVLVDLAVGRPVVGAVRRRHPALLGPVVAYLVVISAMVISALACGNAVAAAGAVLFFASDALIAWNRFVQPLEWAPLAIIVTYHLGQTGLVLSLLRP